MSKKILRVSESELVDLLKDIISEQKKVEDLTPSQMFDIQNTKYGSSVGPGKITGQKTFQRPVKMDGSLFLNGIDKIDTNSDAFKKGIESIQNALKFTGKKGLTVDIEGGASNVGTKEGYDNNALAKRRAQNFINSVSKMFPNVTFNSPTSKVGKATVKNSSEANAEQYVKISFMGPELVSPVIGPAVDNTQQVMRIVKQIPKVNPEEIKKVRMVKVCYLIPETMLDSHASVVNKLGGQKV